jgi:hypothetical protein
VEYRLERSFDPRDFARQLFGSEAAVHLLVTMGANIRAAQAYAIARGFNEQQTREVMRNAITSTADIHLYTGGELQEAQTLFLESGPKLSPQAAGVAIAWDWAKSMGDPVLDELGEPLVGRWSNLGSLPPAPREIEWPDQEMSLETPAAQKARRRAARKKKTGR